MVTRLHILKWDQIVHRLDEHGWIRGPDLQRAGGDQPIESLQVDFQHLARFLIGQAEAVHKNVIGADQPIHIQQIVEPLGL